MSSITARAFLSWRELQVGVDQVVLPVQLVARGLVRLRGLHRRDVGSDRFLPIADAREDVRRHVLRVRRRRRDRSVELGGIEPLLGDRRIVVEMDQIVRHARMSRLPLEDRLEDCRALELVGVGLVGGRRRHVERDRIGDLRLVVVGVFRGQRLHRLEIGLHARAVLGLVVVDVHRAQSVDDSRARARSWRRPPWPSGSPRGLAAGWAQEARCADC